MAATTPKKTTQKVKAPVTAQDEVAAETAEAGSTIKLTVRDIEVEVPTGVLNDFELMVHIMAVDMGDAHAVVHTDQGLKMMLGLEQYAEVMAKLREAGGGSVSIEDAMFFFVDLIKAVLPNS